MEEIFENKNPKKTGKVFNEPYNIQRINRLKGIIKGIHEQGGCKFYSIFVDGEMVVAKNDNIELFDNYHQYMEPNTQQVEIRLHFGRSPNCNRHIFHTNQTALSGVPAKDVEQRIKEALEKQKMETEIDLLKKELKRKSKKLKQFKTLQEELDDKQIDIKDLIKQGMEIYGQFNANKAGAINPTVHGAPEVEVEVESEPETKADKHYQKMKNEYSEKELEKALKTWEIFTAYPELRKEFTELVNHKIKQNGEA